MKTVCRVAFARIDRSNPYAGTCQRVFDSQERGQSLIFDKFYFFRSTAESRISVRNPADRVQRPRFSVPCSLFSYSTLELRCNNSDSWTFTGPKNESSRNWLSRQIPRHCTVSSRVFEPITAENLGVRAYIQSWKDHHRVSRHRQRRTEQHLRHVSRYRSLDSRSLTRQRDSHQRFPPTRFTR